ncbi:UDP-N-acetylmuramate dehydrogenase [Macrococcoides bohemicum]|uniref:UDP-N-acetylenolpyruvoylglucosamine reductase n=1 Tax=Macrococcoides bohemicum TaxID=1903056 RepID=A0AAE7Q4L1_9STAP|nr:UDP-N-acetylmuramate dehydrogenase [Macrococcus bohemicus]MBC9874703.1 UDP-N-acetylmuramate dehydrogenase [Macrococcus bohemicus]QRN49290.1 UDP-N-acetylmuramate dehydrogenase [Macrococcus bohemicus]QYA43051.1 UDP-N-acetylmuramate dehydrogenase [Macrococcus bohemicus]QYA45405.1 UDP-N-acetylmuramate dehydrogenase [Macrococcus bohemicus]
MQVTEIYKQLSTIIDPTLIKMNEPLKNYTYTKTGGNADIYITPIKYSEIQKTIQYANENNITVTFLGNGSNIIIRDGGIRGIVISLLGLTDVQVEYDTIIASSGAAIIDVSRIARDHHLTGLEFACGIPGSVGGAVYMNAGAYGGEVKDVIESATVVDHHGEILTLTNEALALDYRTSIIQSEHYVVLEATFKLQRGDINLIQSQMDILTERREDKQPLEYPSCGSVFRRPTGHFAGQLIQEAGLQGYRMGGVEVSKKHAGFIVNVDNGTATDYEEMIAHVQKVVLENSGIELQPEVRVIGEKI